MRRVDALGGGGVGKGKGLTIARAVLFIRDSLFSLTLLNTIKLNITKRNI